MGGVDASTLPGAQVPSTGGTHLCWWYSLYPALGATSSHDYQGLEEGSGDSFGDANEVALAGEDLDHGCLRKLGQVGLGAVAEPSQGLRVACD